MTSTRPVVVQELPQRLTRGQTEPCFREVQPLLKKDHPKVVFDFSNVSQLDSAGIDFLLICMEEVLKRNGDLKLAAIPLGPAVVLELMGVDHLFEIFENSSDAVESFHRFPEHAFQGGPQLWYSNDIPGREGTV